MSADEWQIRVEGAHQRDEFWYQLAIHQAWHTVYLTLLGKSKKFPSLAAHLKKFAPTKAQQAEAKAEPWRVSQDMMRSLAKKKPTSDEMPAPRKRKAER